MSRILRRPMFRGGRVDSRGTGITSGLMDDTGYADGGRVGFQIGGFSRIPGINDLSQVGIYNPYIPTNTMMQQRQQRIREMEQRGDPLIDLFTPTASQRLQREIELAKPRTEKQVEEAQQRGLDITRSKPFEISDESFPPRKTIEESNKGGAGTLGKGDIDLLDADEKEITRQAKLYEKLLGGEEAKSQAAYDALLAAAPAFFKGKNLREAAPQVLESINKSGAFDKPRDIKQAAAQLAIQRRILMDKASAEEKQRLAILSMKNQKDVFDVLKDQGIPIASYAGSYEASNKAGNILVGKYYITNDNVLVRIDKDKTGQPKPTPLGRI
jgi:hypothetical protein